MPSRQVQPCLTPTIRSNCNEPTGLNLQPALSLRQVHQWELQANHDHHLFVRTSSWDLRSLLGNKAGEQRPLYSLGAKHNAPPPCTQPCCSRGNTQQTHKFVDSGSYSVDKRARAVVLLTCAARELSPTPPPVSSRQCTLPIRTEGSSMLSDAHDSLSTDDMPEKST
eukprot:2034559-Amphidinium_carterae.1